MDKAVPPCLARGLPQKRVPKDHADFSRPIVDALTAIKTDGVATAIRLRQDARVIKSYPARRSQAAALIAAPFGDRADQAAAPIPVSR